MVEPRAVAKRTRIRMDALGGAELSQLAADSPERLAAQRVPSGLVGIGPWHRLTVVQHHAQQRKCGVAYPA